MNEQEGSTLEETRNRCIGGSLGFSTCPKIPQEITKIQIGRQTALLPEAQQAVAQSIRLMVFVLGSKSKTMAVESQLLFKKKNKQKNLSCADRKASQ